MRNRLIRTLVLLPSVAITMKTSWPATVKETAKSLWEHLHQTSNLYSLQYSNVCFSHIRIMHELSFSYYAELVECTTLTPTWSPLMLWAIFIISFKRNLIKFCKGINRFNAYMLCVLINLYITL